MPCSTCRYGEIANDEAGARFVYCRALPPRPVVFEGALHWVQPPMKLTAFCGLFKLSLWKMIRGHGS